MKVESIHNVQRAYRKVLNAISRPGHIESIREESNHLAISLECYKETQMHMMILLDGEVTFNVVTHKEGMAERINKLTYAKEAELAQADFIFILEDASKEQVKKALKEAKTGTFINPHQSATIIMEVKAAENPTQLLLRGPGIREQQQMESDNEETWLEIRNEKNKEYPLGIDMFFTKSTGYVVALPRTTQVRREGTTWDM